MKAKKNSKSVYILKIMSIYALSAVILAVGSAVVSVNCHNRVSSSKMVLFDVERRGTSLLSLLWTGNTGCDFLRQFTVKFSYPIDRGGQIMYNNNEHLC